MQTKAVVITDIVRSSSMQAHARKQLDEDLQSLFVQFNQEYEQQLSAVFDTSLGDEFQAVFSVPEAAVHAVFLTHAWLASQAKSGPIRVRSAIGIGAVTVENSREPRRQDGPAFHTARRLLNHIHDEKQSFGIACNGPAPIVAIANTSFDVGCRLIDAIVNTWTVSQWEASYWRWRGLSSREIATQLGIKPPNVSKRLKGASFWAIDAAIDGFEAILRDPALGHAIAEAPEET